MTAAVAQSQRGSVSPASHSPSTVAREDDWHLPGCYYIGHDDESTAGWRGGRPCLARRAGDQALDRSDFALTSQMLAPATKVPTDRAIVIRGSSSLAIFIGNATGEQRPLSQDFDRSRPARKLPNAQPIASDPRKTDAVQLSFSAGSCFATTSMPAG